jgi:lipoyl(octanoyl) transferase
VTVDRRPSTAVRSRRQPSRGPDSPARDRHAPDAAQPEPQPLQVRRLGTVSYGEALALQRELVERRRANEVPDQLLLLEHPHVITLGTAADSNHVLLDPAERQLMGIELFETGRGGDVTYHGPGQLVGYPILALEGERRDLHRYVRDIEEVLVRSLADFGVKAGRKPGLTGVWVGDEKIVAIGVRVSRGWITSHGFAFNLSTNLDFFDAIVPCGIREYGVTSLERLVGGVDPDAVRERVVARFTEVFERRPA